MTVNSGSSMLPGRRARTGAAAVFPVPRQRLLVVSDGPREMAVTLEALADKLKWPRLAVTDLDEAAWAVTVNKPSAVVLLGTGDLVRDRTLVGELRGATRSPIVVVDDLSATHVVAALVAGADDVMGTEVSREEMAGRLLAIVRRTAEGSDAGARYLSSGSLRVDLWGREVTRDLKPLPLTPTEFRLLVHLMENAGRAVPSKRIIYRVWGWSGPESINTLRISITRLRKKLGDEAKDAQVIRSVRGHGYVFVPRVMESADAETASKTEDGEHALMKKLADKCDQLGQGPDVTAAAQRIVEGLVNEGTVDAVGLHLVSGGSLKLVAHRGFSAAWEEVARELRLEDQQYASIQSIFAAEPLQVGRLRPRSFPGTITACSAEFPGTYLFVPMKSGGTVVGTLGLLRHSPEPFGPVTISYLQAVASLCGTCLEPVWRAAAEH